MSRRCGASCSFLAWPLHVFRYDVSPSWEDDMQLGMVGLGKMGANMTTRLVRGGHEVVAFDRTADAVKAATTNGARGANTLEDLVKQLAAPRAVWIMVPAGDPTENTVRALADLLASGDTIIDG